MTPPTQVTQNPETPSCRQNEAAKSQKPRDSAKQIGEIQKPNNSADQFGKIGHIRPPNGGVGGLTTVANTRAPNVREWYHTRSLGKHLGSEKGTRPPEHRLWRENILEYTQVTDSK